MTTHQGHDHPNTKAGRAACRKAGMASVTNLGDRIRPEGTEEKASKARHPSSRKSPKREPNLDPALPHAFDSDTTNPKRCYVCKRNESANVHSEGPSDLGMLFNFTRR